MLTHSSAHAASAVLHSPMASPAGFANDLLWLYFNNSGFARLTIERLT